MVSVYNIWRLYTTANSRELVHFLCENKSLSLLCMSYEPLLSAYFLYMLFVEKLISCDDN